MQPYTFFSSKLELRRFVMENSPDTFEFGVVTPPTPPELTLPGGSREMRKYLKKRHDVFAVQRPLIFDWDMDNDEREVWGGCR